MEERAAVERLKRGDIGGLELLVRRYHTRAVRAAYLIVRDRASAPMRKDEKPDSGPFVFEFEIPVSPSPVVEVGQKVTTKGVTLTLERVLNYPARPQAFVCFEPPNDDYLWRPSTAPTGFQRDEPLPVHELEGDRWSLTLEDPVEGPSSVKVTELLGYPQTKQAMQEDEDGKEIRGPWTFEFEAPDP